MTATTVAAVDRDEAARSISESFERMTALARRNAREFVARVDVELQPAAWAVLRQVLRGDRVQAHTVAAELGMDKSAVSRHLKELRVRDLVETERDDRDARIVWIAATEQAKERATAAMEQWMTGVRTLLDGWTPEEAETFATLLERFSHLDWTGNQRSS